VAVVVDDEDDDDEDNMDDEDRNRVDAHDAGADVNAAADPPP
jgi:hypothetical protein